MLRTQYESDILPKHYGVILVSLLCLYNKCLHNIIVEIKYLEHARASHERYDHIDFFKATKVLHEDICIMHSM